MMPIDKAIHLCVDMQRIFSRDGLWETPWMERVLPTIAAIAARCPERTVFTRFIPPRQPEEMPGAWQDYYKRWRAMTQQNLDERLLELVEPLQELVPPAHLCDKAVYSAFAHRWRKECAGEGAGIFAPAHFYVKGSDLCRSDGWDFVDLGRSRGFLRPCSQ